MNKKNTILIIGAGGAGSVVVKKCFQNTSTFTDIHLASRTLSKCEALKKTFPNLSIYRLDANDIEATTALIEKINAKLVINMALPYQDLAIMQACLNTKTHYMDTANYESEDNPRFCYAPQWALQDAFKKNKIMALLGSGFDPGVTNVFCAYAQKHLFDQIESIDIVDCNNGDHGHAFATNFNVEINIREITQNGRYYKDGEWVEVPALSQNKTFEFPSIGKRKAYLIYHEELESLAKHIPSVKELRFWMTFSDSYLTHLKVLENIGMTKITPISFQGKDIVPLQFLNALLPEPASLAKNYTGNTCIGCYISGQKNGQSKTVFIYNTCDHQACYKEVQAQAVSYTTGVPAMIGAKLMLEEKWMGEGVFNIEEMDPDPFMEALNKYGLPWELKTC